MFSLGSTDDTFPLPGIGMTIKKLVFPLKGKEATCRDKDFIQQTNSWGLKVEGVNKNMKRG